MIGMKIGKWTENLGALATWGVGALVGSGGVAGLDATRKRDRESGGDDRCVGRVPRPSAIPVRRAFVFRGTHSRGRVGNVGILC
jgi:hypothetical protein